MPLSSPKAETVASPTESRKRFQTDTVPHVPLLTLDRHGDIQSLTEAARRVLEYESGAPVDECFFSHVHRRNVRRVMRDLANMVSRGQTRAQWLLRLRTGRDRWRWYRAFAERASKGSADRIHVHLRPL